MINLDKNKKYNFLLVRCDRIGDLALSIQCLEAIKSLYKHSNIYFLVSSYTKDILKSNPFVDKIICIDECKSLSKEIKKLRIHISISLFADKKSSIALFLAGVKYRIGNFAKIHSLLFNYKIKQKRSKCIKNEAQYNLDLLKPLGINKIFYPKIYLDLNEKNQAINSLEQNFRYFNDKKFIIIHPGSANSAKEWGVFNFLELANILAANHNILISGSHTEINLYSKYIEKFIYLSNENLLKPSSLRKFLGFISCANLFISNSTGPLHCASALGIQTIGFYPFKKPMDPIRWGPFNNKVKHFIATPLGIFTQKTLLDFKEKEDDKISQDDEIRINMRLIKIEEILRLINNECI